MNNIIKRVWNQNRMVTIEDLRGMAFQAEIGGHTFEISGINDANEAVSLSGTVAGVFMRPDGADVALTGTASDGVVSVTLSDACYAVAGRFGLYIFVTSDSKKTCVYACIGTVAQTSYGTVAGDTPQDVVDLINAINAAIASIPADYSDLLDSIAPSFSDSTEYASGTIVWYDGVLYQFTADKATGSWDATKVRQISVATARFNTANFEDGAVTLPKLGADVVEELDTKADTDGSYESMTVGNAEQLISSVGITDQTPYNFRTSGGSAEIGDREELNAVVGLSVPWNQLLNPTMAGASGTYGGVNVTRNRDGSITFNGTATANSIYSLSSSLSHVETHKYFMGGYKKVGNNTGYISHVGLGLDKGNGCVFSAPAASSAMDVLVVIKSGDVFGNVTMYPILVNLTLALGSTIADYIYALEHSNAGAGVAYFRKLFPKPFYQYNSGALLSVRTNLHRMVGFNQFDKSKAVNGKRFNTTGITNVSTAFSRTDWIRVIPNTTYYFKDMVGRSDMYAVFWYDADKNYITADGISGASPKSGYFTSPANAYYVGVNFRAVDIDSVCVSLRWDGERDGEYEPSVAHTYALDDIILRGILKLDANNNLYADGDRYLPNGTVNRRYTEHSVVASNLLNNGGDDVNSIYRAFYHCPDRAYTTNVVCDRFTQGNADAPFAIGVRTNGDGIEFRIPYSAIGVSSSDTDNAKLTAAKAWFTNNVTKLVYELATPTTETANPYQQTQIVDDFGTEEFVDAAVEANERDVAIPVGNETVYKPNLRAKLEMAPDSPDGDGDYIVRQTNGQNSYIPLVEVKELPDFPSNDGFYKLHCTVTDGTTTLSWVSDS